MDFNFGGDFEELYQAVILDHSRKPRNFGPLPDATATVQGDNPTCGDEVAVSVRIDPEQGDKVAGIGFTGEGCSICMASASLMTTVVKGKTKAEAEALYQDFQSMITGKTEAGAAPASLGNLRLLSGVGRFPQRIKCATLSWHALKGALADGQDGDKPRSFSVDANDPGF